MIVALCLLLAAGCGSDGEEDEQPDVQFVPPDAQSPEDSEAKSDWEEPPPEDTWNPPDLRPPEDEEQPDAWIPPEPDVEAIPDIGATPEVIVEPPTGPCNSLQDKASIDDLKQSYQSGNWKTALVDLMDRRYDPGHYILTHVKDQSRLPMFVNNGSFQDLVMSASTAVHEMNHLYGWELGGWSNYAYVLCGESVLVVPNIDTPMRSVVYAIIPPGIGGLLMDYADIYLTGSMGQQGMFTLLDELNAYTHSIFVDYQLVDQFPWGMSVSSIDGIAAFMLFSELYLKWVRENQAGTYNTILATPGVEEMVLQLWSRAEWILEASADHAQSLNIDADPVLDAVFDPDNYMEIQLLLE
jgi:hypothetical protein